MSADGRSKGTETPDTRGAGPDVADGTAPAEAVEGTHAKSAETTDTGVTETTDAGVAEGTETGVTEGTGAGVVDGPNAGVDDRTSAGADDRTSAGAEDGARAEPTVRDAVSAPDATGRPRRTTRRFPLFTRDTARPEGGGRAAPRGAPAPARQWPILAVLSAVGLGLLLTALDVFRFGTILIGAALLGAAALRWMLPDVGMLAVRSRFTDMVTYGVLGVAIVLLALMAQPSVLEIPFLDDTLHFTVR